MLVVILNLYPPANISMLLKLLNALILLRRKVVAQKGHAIAIPKT